ncbi:HEAT repeat domain-containing protein [Streptomyces sp. SID11385]|uniref:HEAT repeat domain-containing protein n=1 Tax=Streptomyces sp. SID11385 TaxID=2706031 RepID=UPI0013CBFC24|nr:HEAT repeat domain-containing protein [Streptomyces sp. SID11385]NEA41048.1 HEAT repeat domain-containing protein [Streptomyces sp. SID11385]
MTMREAVPYTTRVLRALESEDGGVRLRAALAAGTRPDAAYVDALVARCAVEPEFGVREMLTWALIRQPEELTVPLLVAALRTEPAQARAQALHTLSKIAEPATWEAITPALLDDPDDEVARTAWRTAVVLVPEGEEAALAVALAGQLGRGVPETRLSLSRALLALGAAARPVLAEKEKDADPEVRAHALATEDLRQDPSLGFAPVLEAAKRVVALGPDGP